MIINIEKSKNIKKVEFEILDQKLNIVIGPSGSGKSSICEALTSENLNDLMSLYFNEEPLSSINGTKLCENNYSIMVFNDNYKNKVVINRVEYKNDIFNIFVGDNSEYNNYLDDFNTAIQVLDNNRNEIEVFIEKIQNLEKEILKLTSKEQVHKSSKLSLFENKVETLNNDQIKVIKKTNSDYFNWFKQGSENFLNENKRCPFCNRKLSERVINLIEIITSMDNKELKILDTSRPLLEDLNIRVPNFFNKRELNNLKRVLTKKIKVKNQLVNLLNYLHMYSNVDSTNSRHIKKINISKMVYEEFENLDTIIEKINETIPSLNNSYNKCMNHLTKRIKKSENELNQYLSIFGIPYRFTLNEFTSNSKEANYVLCHINDSNKTERTFGLSYGEKNIISLLLFLINVDYDLIIIDDPASSFDEYKRKTIYDLILSKTKGKTTLLLSHDFVFGKFLAYDKYKNRNDVRLGKLMFLENFDFNNDVTIKDLNYLDFQSLESHIYNYFNECTDLMYSEKIVLLRLLFEKDRHRVKYKSIYSYLSAVLHHENKSSILESLSQANLSEEHIINNIVKLLQENGVNDFYLPSYNQNYQDETNNLFIKLMLLREHITNRRMKKELSSIIHLNEAHVIQLNPLRFNVFSKSIYDCINP